MHYNAETLAKGRHFLATTLIPRYAGFRSPNPLKIGVLDDIRKLHPNVPAKVTRAALYVHCGAFKYLLLFKASKIRVDLSGADAGELDPLHAKSAALKLRELDAKRRKAIAGPKAGSRKGPMSKAPSKAPSKASARVAAREAAAALPPQIRSAGPVQVQRSATVGASGRPILTLLKRSGPPAR